MDFSLFYSDGLHLVEKGNLELGKAIDSTIAGSRIPNRYKNAVCSADFNLNLEDFSTLPGLYLFVTPSLLVNPFLKLLVLFVEVNAFVIVMFLQVNPLVLVRAGKPISNRNVRPSKTVSASSVSPGKPICGSNVSLSDMLVLVFFIQVNQLLLVFKNGPSKICGRQPSRKLKEYGLPVFHQFYLVPYFVPFE